MTNLLFGQISSHRQLFIFSDYNSKALKQQQLELLKKEAGGVEERDLKVVDAEKQLVLYKRYKVDTNRFTVILVGKDGYEKFRSDKKVVEMAQLFAIIDAMPMRRREMKKGD